jgi:PEP-CTERM motif
MRKTLRWALIAAVGLVPVGAKAATYVFAFSTTDSIFTVTGAITTADTLDAVGGYDVLSVSGTISGPGGGPITLEPNPSQPSVFVGPVWTYDDVYFPADALRVDENGILFSAGAYSYNLYSTGPTTYFLSSDNPAGVYDPGEAVTFGDPVRTASLASAPEPSTWTLILLGFAGLGLAARRQARTRLRAVQKA